MICLGMSTGKLQTLIELVTIPIFNDSTMFILLTDSCIVEGRPKRWVKMLESQVESDFTQDQLPGKTAKEEGVHHERISTGLQFYIHP
jgi:hypothetical protein